MAKILRKVVKFGAEKLGKRDETLSGPEPRFVSYKENGKDQPVMNADLHAASCHSYLGKMQQSGEGTYSDDVIIALLKYFFDRTKKGEKVVIELANVVSELLNGPESMEGSMDFETQKKHILKLANNIKKSRKNDVEIINIEDNNKRLFETLRKKGVAGLDTGEHAKTIPEVFDSLDIARYLYWVTKQDAQYMEEVRDLKSEEMKQLSGDSDYYGLVEMAIRINALLHGITLQSGVGRQKKYDAFLLKHINPHIKDFPLLHDFQEFCQQKLQGNTFNGLYFDTKKSEHLVHKLESRRHLGHKARNIAILTAGLILGTLGTKGWMAYDKQKQQQLQTQETIKEIFENKQVESWSEFGQYEYTGDDKIEKINAYTQDIYERFILRYGGIGDYTEDEFKQQIIDCLNNQDVLDRLSRGSIGSEPTCAEDVVIDNYLIPQNIGAFKLKNISTHPYERLLPYTDAFINTILLEDGFDMALDDKNIQKDLGEYGPFNVGAWGGSRMRYGMAIVTDPNAHNAKKYIACTNMYCQGFKEDRHELVTSGYAKDLAIDFLKQAYPVINEVIGQYMIRYYKLENMSDLTSVSFSRDKLLGDLENLLIKDFLHKGLLKKFDKDDTEKIIQYLDGFIIEHQDTLGGLTGDINKNLLPNGFLQDHEQEMRNTIQDQDVIDWDALPEGFADDLVNYLGIYRASDGKIYRVGHVKIGNKWYFYADEKTSHEPALTLYSMYEGKEVAEDYFKTKAKFLEKKILLEKKLKSASQRHTEPPR